MEEIGEVKKKSKGKEKNKKGRVSEASERKNYGSASHGGVKVSLLGVRVA